MSPEEVIAAAFAEAAEKREAAEAAVAAIGDPKKVAMVRDDALKAKPTTTAGRLIKAANNADQRAEKIQAGGGGDGRALRVQGVRKSEKSFGAKTPGKPGRPAGSGARAGADAGLKPSEAPLMERAGAGAEAFEFRPPLAKTPQAAAAAAYAAVAEEAKREEDEPEDAVDVIDPPGDAEATIEGDALKKKETRTSRDANPGADGEHMETATKKRRRVSTEKTPSVSSKALPAQGAPVSDEGAELGQEANAKDEKAAPKSAKKKKDDAGNKKKTGKKPAVGAAGWGDGDRELAGDKRVTKWLEFRGFGEYAAAFAARGITLDKLKALTMSDLEDVNVEGAAMREKIFAAAAEFAKEAAERAAKRAEKNKTGPSEPPKKKSEDGASRRGVKPGLGCVFATRGCDVATLVTAEQPFSTTKKKCGTRHPRPLLVSVGPRGARARLLTRCGSDPEARARRRRPAMPSLSSPPRVNTILDPGASHPRRVPASPLSDVRSHPELLF
jgi:hypothetical protein